MGRCSVFCIVEIPTTTLDHLLRCSEEYLEEHCGQNQTVDVSKSMVIIDTKNIASITGGSLPPVTSCPTVFFNHTLQEVHDWFLENITDIRPNGFMPICFLVLDDRSAKDGTCIFVSTQDSTPGALRCTFDLALQNAVHCDIGRSITEGSPGVFMRSGVTMTKANLKLVLSRGLYMERGEVLLDQNWRDFCDKWQE